MRSSRGSTYEPPLGDPLDRGAAARPSSRPSARSRARPSRGRRRAARRRRRRCRGSTPRSGRRASSCSRQVDAAAVGQADVDDRDVGVGVLDEVDAGRRRCRPLPTTSRPPWLEQHLEALAQRLVVVDRSPASSRASQPTVPTTKGRKERRKGAHRVVTASATRAYRRTAHGEGHREADPPAVADLVPDGRAAAGHRAGDPPRRRGLQRDERGRVRPALLRRPRRARVARDPAHGRPADRRRAPSRRTTRCARRTSTCPAIAFTDAELAALQTALSLLDGEFAYAEPLRLALQQISWGRPSPLRAPEQPVGRARHHRVAPAATTSRSAWRRSRPRSSATRRSRSTTTRWSATRSAPRKVDPYHLLFQGGQFYLLGRSHERGALRVFRLSRIRGQGRLRDEGRARLQAPAGLRPARVRAAAPTGSSATRRHRRDPRLASASPGRSSATTAASATVAREDDGPSSCAPTTPTPRQLASWVARPAASTRACSRRPSWPTRSRRASSCSPSATTAAARARAPAPRVAATRRTARPSAAARASARRRSGPSASPASSRSPSILIEAGRARRALVATRSSASACRSPRPELREDVNVLNVVNFGGGSYVLYAEITTTARSRSTPSPTPTTSPAPRACCPSRPRRWSRRSTSSASTSRGLADDRAREDRRARSARTRASAACRSPARRRRLGDRARRVRRDRRRRLSGSTTTRPTRTSSPSASSSPTRSSTGARAGTSRRSTPRGGRPPLPPGPHPQTREVTDERLHAPPRGRPRRRRRRLAAHRRGRASRTRARLDLAGARALGARGAPRRRGARRRRGRRRATASRARTGSCARCSRRPATPSCSSRRIARRRAGGGRAPARHRNDAGEQSDRSTSSTHRSTSTGRTARSTPGTASCSTNRGGPTCSAASGRGSRTGRQRRCSPRRWTPRRWGALVVPPFDLRLRPGLLRRRVAGAP